MMRWPTQSNTRLMLYTIHGEYLTSTVGISIAPPPFASPPCSGLSADEPFLSFHSSSFSPSSLVLNSVVADLSVVRQPPIILFGDADALLPPLFTKDCCFVRSCMEPKEPLRRRCTIEDGVYSREAYNNWFSGDGSESCSVSLTTSCIVAFAIHASCCLLHSDSFTYY